MPVYTEGLHTVLAPTVRSVKAAITTYELQGGTANIFVNDDGMQVISDEDAQERQDFYEEQEIGWVARPGHNPNGDKGKRVFVRHGKFKKASNMNYALGLSVDVERKLASIYRPPWWSKLDENCAYYKALKEAREETDGEAWADGDIRIGDYILLIDSDTRVPQDCLLDAVSELEQSPQVAVLQYSSGVYNVTKSFFEKGITFFTNLVYTHIRFAVANGDVAPFVGHNAVLRWSAMQDIAYDCPIDQREKYWSEQTVSEDFEMALRLQSSGYLVRLAAYKGDGFKEGVSLTVYDELMRWEKYAYGCSELLFHPLKQWPTHGPFTKLFRSFIVSSMPLPSKFSILAYIGTYYALGSAWLLTLSDYFLVGWFHGTLDRYYIDSFRIMFSIVCVFTILGNVSLAVLRYRINEKSLIAALCENLVWIPLLVIFLGGISVHISQALLAHLFSVNMTWGSTVKETKSIPFFQEIPQVLRRFKWTFSACLVGAVGMVALAKWVPEMWRITLFTPIWPLASLIVSSFLLPVVLNPNLMLFTW
jgi:membrane glycosyltransferase